MNFKKTTALFLTAALLFSFSACGKSNEEPSDDNLTICTDVSEHHYGQSDEKEDAKASQSNKKPQKPKDTVTQTKAELINVTIPEGYTLVRISWLLEKKGICSGSDFVKAAQNFDLSKYPMLKDVKASKDVCFPLEGYIFPATYSFKKNTPPEQVLNEMLKTTNAKFSGLLSGGKSAQGYNLHQILTIASIIEKEAFTSDQRTKISAVLHNRLKQNMKLQCDVTVKYCTGVIETEYPDKIDHYKYLYNTYRCAALPAGPICNPGMESIRAAITPENIDALYFVISTEPPYEARFSNNYDEHQQNCKDLGF